MLRKTRGQTSVEFLVLLGFMMIVFTSFFVVAQDLIVRNNEKQVLTELENVALHVEEELLIANQVHDGYERTFSLPDKLSEDVFTAYIADSSGVSELVVNTSRYEHLIFLPFPVTVDDAPEGFFKNDNTIIKNNSGIMIYTS